MFLEKTPGDVQNLGLHQAQHHRLKDTPLGLEPHDLYRGK